MSREIEVVFTKEKKGSFTIGQKKSVKPGYAFNYLFPFNFAILNNAENKTKIDSISKEAKKYSDELKKNADKTHKIINGKSISFQVKSHDEGKLYGSISINDVVSTLNINFETTLDKHDIRGFTPIKELGSYNATVMIHKDIRSSFTILVEKEAETEKSSSSKSSFKQSDTSESNVQTYADEDTISVAEEKESSSEPTTIDDTIF